MKVCTIIFGVLVACVMCLAAENGPLMTALQPGVQPEVMVFDAQGNREKRSLLLGAGALGLGALGLGAAGLVGAGLVGAKVGFVGGALVGKAIGRSYGGGYGGGYGGYSGGYGGHYGGGYGYGGHGYRRVYYEPVYEYVVSDPWC